MKITDYKLTIFLLLIFSIAGCQKKDLTTPLNIGPTNSANAMVISGDGFSGTTFYFNTANSSGYYDTSFHQTSLSLVEDTDSINLQIHFHFSGETYFAAQDTLPGLNNVSDTILIANKSSQKFNIYRPLYINDFLTITSFDNAGGHINGVFSGFYINNSNYKDTLKVSNGRFSIIRLPDVY